MKRTNMSARFCCGVLMLFVLTLTGCTKEDDRLDQNQPAESYVESSISQTETVSLEKIEQTEETADKFQEEAVEPVITEEDWFDYFEGIAGAAVIYDPTDNRYCIYNQELASARRSPCSTFKIISFLIALEKGIID